MCFIDVYLFKFCQVLQPIQMSVVAIFDQYGNCTGFSWEAPESGHVSLLRLPCRWREPSTPASCPACIFWKKKVFKKASNKTIVLDIGATACVGWDTVVLRCL